MQSEKVNNFTFIFTTKPELFNLYSFFFFFQLGKLGNILTYITDNGFTIHAMKMFNLERENCEEFYEIYKGVVAEYLVNKKMKNVV